VSYGLWVWLVEEPDGTEGSIAAIVPGLEHLGMLVLQARTEEQAMLFAWAAQQHRDRSGLSVRLAHLVEDQSDLVDEIRDLVDEVKDVITGWTRPMTDREKLESVAKLLGVPESEVRTSG
jgi:hypothetical protein